MTGDPHRPRTRRARRLTLLAAGLVSLGLWTGVAGASEVPDPAATASATTSVELPGWNGGQVDGEAAALVARIAVSMGTGTEAGVDGNGNRWAGLGDVGNRWTGTPNAAGWGNRWAGRNH